MHPCMPYQAVGHHSPPEQTTACDSIPHHTTSYRSIAKHTIAHHISIRHHSTPYKYGTCEICRLERLGTTVLRDPLVHFTRAELVLRSDVGSAGNEAQPGFDPRRNHLQHPHGRLCSLRALRTWHAIAGGDDEKNEK